MPGLLLDDRVVESTLDLAMVPGNVTKYPGNPVLSDANPAQVKPWDKDRIMNTDIDIVVELLRSGSIYAAVAPHVESRLAEWASTSPVTQARL